MRERLPEIMAAVATIVLAGFLVAFFVHWQTGPNALTCAEAWDWGTTTGSER